MPDELTPAEAASRLGVSVDTVRRWIRQGKIKARKEGVKYLIEPDSLPTSVRQDFVQQPVAQLTVMRERIRELEADKAYLQQRIVTLEKHIEALQQTIEAQQRTIDTLTMKALPAPKRRFRDRVRDVFRRKPPSQ